MVLPWHTPASRQVKVQYATVAKGWPTQRVAIDIASEVYRTDKAYL